MAVNAIRTHYFMMFCYVLVEDSLEEIDSFSMKTTSLIIKIHVVSFPFGMIIASFRTVRVPFRDIFH